MAKLIDALKKFFTPSSERQAHPKSPQRRDPQFVGRSSAKEIEQAPPERIGELVGHAPERVDT
jgi:hypothetical protein